MAGYISPGHSRQSSFGQYNIGYDAYDNTPLSQQLVNDDKMSRVQPDNDKDKVNIFIIFVFILELLVLVFVSVLEYFLRVTDVFPVRMLNFTCGDPDLSYTTDNGEITYKDFTYNANVSYQIIIPLCFCIPPVIVLISELALWAFSDEYQKTVRALCKQCKLPQIFRRMVRYIGTFIFGLLVTMIFVDVTKMFVGRLRPNFLDVCNPDTTKCKAGELNGNDICTEKDDMLIRQARLSFPSLHAAMSAFAAGFLAVYLHHIIRASSVRIMRPFLALGFILLSVMCCLSRYGLHYSHWTDVMVGFGIGIIFALYTCVFVLNNFRERLSSAKMYQQLRSFMFEQRNLELRDLYKEDKIPSELSSHRRVPWYYMAALQQEERLPYANYPGAGVYAGGIILPRPHLHANGHANESTTDDNDLNPGDVERIYHPYSTHSLPPSSAQPQPRHYKSDPSPPHAHNTFQRDLQRSVDHYRHNDFGHL